MNKVVSVVEAYCQKLMIDPYGSLAILFPKLTKASNCADVVLKG